MAPKLLPLVALLLSLASACGEAGATGARGERGERFAVDLQPTNGSQVEGTARLSMAENHLTIDMEARGLEPNRIHEQHIHGLVVADEEASCPRSTQSEDRNGNRTIELAEGMSAYGRSLRALEPFPTVGPNGRLDWRLTLTVDPEELQPLENRVLLLRGRSADRRGGQYLPDLPVACGEIRPLERPRP